MDPFKKIIDLSSRFFPKLSIFPYPFKTIEFDELVRNLQFSENDEILDFGCGYGYQTILLAKKKCKNIVGIDPSEEAIHYAIQLLSRINLKKVIFSRGLIEKIQFPNDHFDKVFSFCVIEHIQNYNEIFNEIFRILKPSGHFTCSVDALETIQDPKLRDQHSRKYFVKHYFQKDELKTILRKAGFQNIHVYPIFKSDFAKKLFINSIQVNSKINLIHSFLEYLRLKVYEMKSANETRGLFLVARCTK